MNSETKSFLSQIQPLFDNHPDFPQKLKQHFVFTADKVSNAFKFISALFSKGLLCDGSNDLDAIFGSKEMMVQHAMILTCSQGAGGIGGLMESLEETGNLQLISDFQAWVKKDFDIEIECDVGKPNAGEATAGTSKSGVLPRQEINVKSSYGTKLVDKIMAHVEGDFMKQLEGHLIGKASDILNFSQFCSTLTQEKVRDEDRTELATAPDGQSIGSVQILRKQTVQNSSNEGILVETYKWLENSAMRKRNYSQTAATSPANKRSKKETKTSRSNLFEQAALPDKLSNIATLTCQQSSTSKGASLVQFDKKRMMACTADGTLNLWNLGDGKEEPINIPVKKNITCFQYNEEILVLGTAEGAVHLFDAKTYEKKWSFPFEGRVTSLKFAGSTIAIITRKDDKDELWWMEISGWLRSKSPAECPLLNDKITGIFMCRDISFVYANELVHIFHLFPGYNFDAIKPQPCYLMAPACTSISTLTAWDLTSKRRVIAGCMNGAIAIWNTSRFTENQKPAKTFHKHRQAIVSLCFLNDHLLSLDRGGKFLMWAGQDVDNKKNNPAPRMSTENSSWTHLASHEDWFATCSSKDYIMNIWTVPDS